jgi:hypothetical protein
MSEAVSSAVVASVETAATPVAVVDPSSIKPNEGESIGDYARRVQRATGPADDASDDDGEEEATAPDKPAPKPETVKAPDVKALQALAKDGKYKEVLEALGIEVDGTKIPAARFAEFRKMQEKERGKLERRASEVTAKEQAVNQQIQTVLKDYEGFSKAKRAWDEGDVVGAIEAAFGESLDSISDKAMKQKLSSDPEVHRLKRKLELKERQEKELSDRQALEQQAQQRTAQETKYIESLQTALEESADPVIVKACKRKDFKQAVFNAQLHAYRTEGVEITPDEAAERVIETIKEAHLSWSEVFGTTSGAPAENTVATGKASPITAPAGRSPEKPRAPKTVSQVKARATPDQSLDDLDDETRWKRLRDRAVRELRQQQLAED